MKFLLPGFSESLMETLDWRLLEDSYYTISLLHYYSACDCPLPESTMPCMTASLLKRDLQCLVDRL